MYLFRIPTKTVSEANLKEHRYKSYNRHKLQKRDIDLLWMQENLKIKLPCTVILTRCSARTLDDDNLRIAFKWIRDRIAQKLFPGTKPGQADSHPDIIWKYDQQKSKWHGTMIEILENGEPIQKE